jgi:hypothetical protein
VFGPVSLEVMLSVTFWNCPAMAPVTFITTWQPLLPASEAALNRTLLSPASEAAPLILVTVPHPSGVNVKVVFSRVIPVGNVSSTRTDVSAVVLGLVMVRVSVVLPP